MPISATPAYLGQDFSHASPGLRFGMYLPLWDESFALLKDQKTAALKKATKLTPEDQKISKAIVQRQSHTAQVCTNVLTLDAIATAPFTTGLGNEHPLENGFAFLNPYGLPYLPGSGVKGVLRQAARELVSGEWSDSHGWSSGKVHLLGKIKLSTIDALFGLESKDGDKEHVRGALSFWDALPQIPGGSLAVDIMTPHQSHYYQQNLDRKSGDSTSPHESGQPTPISFLTLPPGTQFAFHVQCDMMRLEHMAPDLAHNNHWQTLLTAAFEHAFAWLGFGAKTAVGYGSMERDHKAEAAKQEAAKAAQAQAELASLTPEERQLKDLQTLYEDTKAKGPLNPSCEVAAKRLELLDAALTWESASLRQAVAELLRRIAKDLPWAKKRKEEANEKLAKLTS